MNRTSILSFIIVAGGTGALLASTAQSQLGVPKNQVVLQPSTPGTSQSGHTNISGTARAGQFVGGGAGLTGVNAAQLGGLPAGAYLTAIPLPLSLFGSDITGVLRGTNTSTASFAAGVLGSNTATSGNTIGVYGYNQSPNGSAVYAQNTATSGQAQGVLAFTASTDGIAVHGICSSPTGPTTGVLGVTNTSSGRGVHGFSSSSTGLTAGVQGETFSSAGYGIYGVANSTTGTSYGGYFKNFSDAGTALYGESLAGTGTTFGIHARNLSTSGTALFAHSAAISGFTRGVYGLANSPQGIGGEFANSAGGIALSSLGQAVINGDLRVSGGGNLGIGVAGPIFPIDFAESIGEKISLFGTSTTSNYGLGIDNGVMQIHSDFSTSAVAFGYGSSTNFTERVRFVNNSDIELQHANTDLVSFFSAPYDLLLEHDRDSDSSDAWLRVFTNGFSLEQLRVEDGDEAATRFDGSVNPNGIDYAEAFKIMDPSLEAGDLVVNMGSSWEHITRSTKAYDSGVIGVISTKPAFVAGMSFDAEDKINPELTKRRDAARKAGDRVLEKQLTVQMTELVKAAYRPVAFMGRVPVKVTGPVQVGDHLTSSNIPGVAMAMNLSGQSIGIALESNPGGNGKIMVMIQPKYWTPTIPTGSGGLTEVVAEMKKKMEAVVAENRELRQRVNDLEERLSRLEKSMNRR